MRALASIVAVSLLLGCSASVDESHDGLERPSTSHAAALRASVPWAFVRPGVGAFTKDEGGALVPDLGVVAPLARVALPGNATGVARVADADGLASVAFTLEGAEPAKAIVEGGFVSYPQSFGAVVHRVTSAGTEDFVVFERRPAVERLRYDVEIDAAGLRLVANTLELVDAHGIPRLHVAPPFAVDAAGHRKKAELSVQGCAFDTDPSSPKGRRPTPPGARHCTIDVTWRGVRYPLAIDPSWTSAHTMAVARQLHTATTVAFGVAIIGGFGVAPDYDGTDSVEFYLPPPDDVFEAQASMAASRGEHTTTDLGAGQVLIAGGADSLNDSNALAEAEVYLVSVGTVSTLLMNAKRATHTATTLASGDILLAGGTGSGMPPLAEIYSAGAFSLPASQMIERRSGHSASRIVGGAFDGQVLVAGGIAGSNFLADAERYDPVAQTFVATATPMSIARVDHTSTELGAGKVLVAGGGDVFAYYATTEIYDWAIDGFAVGPAMAHARGNHTATTLLTGQIVMAGGYNLTDGTSGVVEVESYDPVGNAFSPFGSLVVGRAKHATALLPDQLLLTGGAANTASNDAELGGLPCGASGDCASGFCVAGLCCNAACAGVCDACSAVVKGVGADGDCGFVAAGGLVGQNCDTDIEVQLECDGNGGVTEGMVQDCKPYKCATSSTCAVGPCSDDSTCSSNAYCDASTHACIVRKDNGASCATGDECASMSCADGTCCNSACTGTCEACDEQGFAGACIPIHGAPHHGACSGTGSCSGFCDGTAIDTCAFPGDTRSCGTASCSGSTLTHGVCNQHGACTMREDDCGGFVCGVEACLEKCSKGDDCASGYFCDADGACAQIVTADCTGPSTLTEAGGATRECSPYVCDPGASACRSSCASVRDCAKGFVCSASNACVPLPDNPLDSGCAIRAREPEPLCDGWIAAFALALAGLGARRARRA